MKSEDYDKELVCLSLGAGVQSSALALMCMHEMFEMPDFAVFADTGDESKATYEWLDWLEGKLGFPVIRACNEQKLSEHVFESIKNGTRVSKPPLFTEGQNGASAGLLTRDCTGDFKVAVIQRAVRKEMKAKNKKTIRQWIGISLDEVQRMKPSRVKYSTHEWPLIDARLTRHDCLLWMERNGYPEPPRSACVYCPHHSNKEWRRIRDEDKDGWARSVEFDKRIRSGLHGVKSLCFVHRSCVPLDEVDLRDDSDKGQGLLWGNECEGMCGV
jgi:hypothetical protein